MEVPNVALRVETYDSDKGLGPGPSVTTLFYNSHEHRGYYDVLFI